LVPLIRKITYVFYKCFEYYRKILIRFYERQALSNLATSNFKRAEGLFKKIGKIDPYRRGVNYNLGLVYLSMKRYAEAEVYFLKEIEKEGKSYILVKALGDLYYIWAKRIRALDCYNSAYGLSVSEKDRNFLLERIRKCEDENVFSKVRLSLEHLEFGNKFLSKKRFDEAAEEFRKAMFFDDTNFLACNNLAVILMNYRREYTSALELFKKADFLVDLPVIKQNIKILQLEVIKGAEK